MPLTSKDLDNLLGRVKSKATGVDFYWGVDPGTHTGLALWDSRHRRLVSLQTTTIVKAMELIMSAAEAYRSSGVSFMVVVEDTRKLRLPKAMQSKGRERGAGSVAREMGIWSEWLTHYGIPHIMAGLSPKEFRKGDQAWFAKKTGWGGRTSEHARAAAGLIWGR